MELILSIVIYLLQIALILGLAAIIPIFVVHRKKVCMRSKLFFITYLICLAMLCGGIFYIAYHPLVYCPDQLRGEFTKAMKKDAMALNGGFYSRNIPIFPVMITIHDISQNGEVLVETRYWFLGGTTQMVFGGQDAPAIVREITGQ